MSLSAPRGAGPRRAGPSPTEAVTGSSPRHVQAPCCGQTATPAAGEAEGNRADWGAGDVVRGRDGEPERQCGRDSKEERQRGAVRAGALGSEIVQEMISGEE